MFKKQYIPFLHAAETRICVANEALQLQDGCRYNPDYDIQRLYRDARIVDISKGTKKMQKRTIALDMPGRS